ncbi:nose resistant to fluoxetine protein 6-like [Dysidea avara]|uniref:nose resistant to fluoxetine protein 6-like n=1 Tax=Dysidea avara TaxID=196820 RepID=UPI00332118B6
MLTILLHLLFVITVVGSCYASLSDGPQLMFPSHISVSSNCQAVIQRLSALQSTHPQLMAQYWDSWGKPSDGIVYGHTTFLGYYDECMDLKNTPVGETNYCIYTMQMNITTFYNPSEYQDEVCYSSDCPVPINTSVTSNIQVGVCYPSTCSPNEFALVLSRMNIISVTSMTVNPFSNTTQTVSIQLTSTGDSPTFCPQTDVEYDTGAIVLIIIIGILIGLVILGTCLDFIWAFCDGESCCKACDGIIPKVILMFSLYRTIPELLSTKQSSSNIKAVGSLKLISNFIVVLFHVYINIRSFYLPLSQNSPQYLDKYPSKMFNQIIMNSTFAVDTFFLISATLSSYLTFKDIEKCNKFRIFYFYVSRYLRLAPLCYFATFVAFKLLVHFSQGPMWHSPDFTVCQSTWWYNIFFINNFLSPEDICLVPVWHLATEMQLFILSPIFILTLFYTPIVGLVIIAICIAGCIVVTGVVAFNNDYWASIYIRPNYGEQMQGLYNLPFFRGVTYLVGVILGYVLYKKYSIADLPIRRSFKQLLCLVMWLTALYLCKNTLFGTIEDMNGTRRFTQWENTTFLMFSGLAWSISISIIIFFCNTGYGGVVNSVLSWPGWDPLVRLSYGVYLLNAIVIHYIIGSLHSSLVFTDTVLNMIYTFTMIVSVIFAALLSVVVEIPLSKIVSLCFKLAGEEPRQR